MSYLYEDIRPRLFTEEGSVTFTRIRDHIKYLLSVAGAVRMLEAIKVGSGDSWTLLACVDRMIELGEIREVGDSPNVAGQHRVFVKARE